MVPIGAGGEMAEGSSNDHAGEHVGSNKNGVRQLLECRAD